MDNLYSLYRNFFPMGVEFSYNLEELKKFSCFYDDVISFWRNENIAFYNANYEKLIQNFENEVVNLLEYLSLPAEKDCFEFYKTKNIVQTASFSQVRQPLFKTSINRWKNFEKELQTLF